MLPHSSIIKFSFIFKSTIHYPIAEVHELYRKVKIARYEEQHIKSNISNPPTYPSAHPFSDLCLSVFLFFILKATQQTVKSFSSLSWQATLGWKWRIIRTTNHQFIFFVQRYLLIKLYLSICSATRTLCKFYYVACLLFHFRISAAFHTIFQESRFR